MRSLVGSIGSIVWYVTFSSVKRRSLSDTGNRYVLHVELADDAVVARTQDAVRFRVRVIGTCDRWPPTQPLADNGPGAEVGLWKLSPLGVRHTTHIHEFQGRPRVVGAEGGAGVEEEDQAVQVGGGEELVHVRECNVNDGRDVQLEDHFSLEQHVSPTITRGDFGQAQHTHDAVGKAHSDDAAGGVHVSSGTHRTEVMAWGNVRINNTVRST